MGRTTEEVEIELGETEKALRGCHPSNLQFMMGRISALRWWLGQHEELHPEVEKKNRNEVKDIVDDKVEFKE